MLIRFRKMVCQENGMALMLTLLILFVVLATVAAVTKSITTQAKVDAAFPDSQGALTHAEDALNVVLAALHTNKYTISNFPADGFSFTTDSGRVTVTASAVVLDPVDPRHSSCTLEAIYTEGINKRTVQVDIDTYKRELLRTAFHTEYDGPVVPNYLVPVLQFVQAEADDNPDIPGHKLDRAIWGYSNHTKAVIYIPKGTKTKNSWNYFTPDVDDQPTGVRPTYHDTSTGQDYAMPEYFQPGDYYNVFITTWDHHDNGAQKWFLKDTTVIANNGFKTEEQFYTVYTIITHKWREVSN